MHGKLLHGFIKRLLVTLVVLWALIFTLMLFHAWCSIIFPWVVNSKSPIWVFKGEKIKGTMYFCRRADWNVEKEWYYTDEDVWWLGYEHSLKFPFNDPRQILMKEASISCLRIIWYLGMYVSDDLFRVKVGMCLDEFQVFYHIQYEVICQAILLISCHEVGCLEYDCGVKTIREVFEVRYVKGYHLFEDCIRNRSPGTNRNSIVRLFEEWTLIHELLIGCCDELRKELALVKLDYWKIFKWKFWYFWERYKGDKRN